MGVICYVGRDLKEMKGRRRGCVKEEHSGRENSQNKGSEKEKKRQPGRLVGPWGRQVGNEERA